MSRCFDEAHKITEWQGFREVFRKVGKICSSLETWPEPNYRILCLSATATAYTRDYIRKSVHFRGSNERIWPVRRENMNLSFHIENYKDGRSLPSSKKMKPILGALNRGDCALVFVNCRDKAESLAREISEKVRTKIGAGRVGFYHSQMRIELRKQTLLWFERGTNSERSRPHFRILVATISLGLGIDIKGQLGALVMWDPPHSISDLIQQSCRAGRNGEPFNADVYLCWRQRLSFKSKILNNLRHATATSDSERIEVLRNELEDLDKVFAMCYSGTCRHVYMDNYFGTGGKPVTPCHNRCDVCVNGRAEGRVTEGQEQLINDVICRIVSKPMFRDGVTSSKLFSLALERCSKSLKIAEVEHGIVLCLRKLVLENFLSDDFIEDEDNLVWIIKATQKTGEAVIRY